jgi:biotin carboxylase
MSERASDKTLLVLAASLYQLPVIERAKARGYRVITTDNVPSNPGHALADKAYSVDTTNIEGVLDIARRENIAGIIAACTDIAVPTAAAVGAALGLAAPTPDAAAVLCDKIRFRTWLVESGLPSPAWSAADAWPGDGAWVLKPNRSSGSKGIFIVRSASELAARLPETMTFSKSALLERFIEGAQVTCEGLLKDGETVASWVTTRTTAPAPFVATWGHRLPSDIGPDAERHVALAVLEVLGRLGVRDGPFDADVVWDGERAYVLEVAPRLGGNSLAELIRAASDVDLVDEAVAYAVREPFGRRPAPRSRPTELLLLGVEKAGLLRYDEAAVDALRAEPWVRSLVMDRRPGDSVQPFTNGRHRIGEALLIADDAAMLAERGGDLRRRLGLSVA